MKLVGNWTLAASPDRAYALLQDPAVLARSMPGCEALDRIAENEYSMRMKMTLASLAGRFDGKVRIADSDPPLSFRLVVEGTGRIGFMKGDGVLRFAHSGSGSTVHYEGEVQVGGTIANVGQRLVETTAKMLIKRFFEKMSMEVAADVRAAAD
ncbi:MAG TPA: carbon monoxide dehydrogenase subunit G [Bryobacteraceae bacterium]|nr:carbon monoxide dehydrogenase subunit G [Bryobacteraceae bacterium]